MSSEPYLLRLATRLSEGLIEWQPDRRERHRQFVLAHQMPDGGFRGREGDSDIYYTSFAVRCLSMLGGLRSEEASKIGSFLQSHDWQTLSIVDLLSWLSSAVVVQLAGGPDVFASDAADWPKQIAERLESVRTNDGGYAKSSEGAAGSTYQSFLVVLAYELIGQPLPRPNALVQFLFDRQRGDGGFVEIAPMKRSGTNPTAAAVATLSILNYLDREICEDVAAYLRDVRSDEGGFQANTRIPFADGLSTFTGLLTLSEIGRERLIDRGQARQFFTKWLEFPPGGFRGASWDEQADVEYTFYGLGALALLSESIDQTDPNDLLN
ncbi:prenyltransferase/squalene oxidase repeat-containing protein [Thalassoroseus pseudoceratinae]|uniref:prenyltransferase/squalene oxidase repeat-containing protein n=1 Tax=Thalassoroseus pseudoceratinae TaxID=2713176 RepID=UPI00142101F0|nr:prenyltransferase/squalene oxidase repeat-containing protein [Thalassoroseus pseudoceratinae]